MPILQGFPKGGGKAYKPHCYPKKLCVDERQIYGQDLFPVCPVLQKIIEAQKLYSMPDSAKTDSPLQDSVNRILTVCAPLMKLRFTEKSIAWCAHRKNFLRDWIEPIRNDLLSLSQRLEDKYPQTSTECKELVAELELAEKRYTCYCNGFLYLLPPDLEYQNYDSFLQWRNDQLDWASVERGSQMKIEMFVFTNTYPAEAIKVMGKLFDKLAPLVTTILPEQLAEKERLKVELSETVIKAIELVQSADGGKGEDETQDDEDNGLSPSRVRARAVHDWAMSKIDGIGSMTYAQEFEAIHDRLNVEIGKAQGKAAEDFGKFMDSLPPNAETFAKYLREAGIKKNSSRGDRPHGGSIVHKSDI